MSRAILCRYTAWLLLSAVILIPLFLWLTIYQWRPVISPLAVFPLLGVWAWSIMWTHYVYGALHIQFPRTFAVQHTYDRLSAWLVLLLIILHPALLAWEQKNQLSILPPESFYAYVSPSLELYILFGSVGLLLFLSYEFFNRLRTKPLLRRHWFWVSLSQVGAMILIFVHGLRIGQTVLSGWGEVYWFVLGVSLLPALIIVATADWRNQQEYRAMLAK